MPPVTGLSGLGAVLANTGADYLNRTRQLDDETRRRAEDERRFARGREAQLQDVQSARAEDDRRYVRGRGDQLSDVQASREREDTVYGRRRDDQLADVGEARLYAESIAYSENVRKLKERLPFEQNLQRSVDEAASQLQQVRQGMANVSRLVMAQPPAIGPNDPAVRARAQQLAGDSRNREEIAREVPKALEQIQFEAFTKHSNSVRAANEVLQSFRATEAQLTDIIQAGIQARVAPSTPPPPTEGATSSLLNPTQPTLRSVGAADLLGALREAGAVPNEGAPGATAVPLGLSPSALLENPTNNAVIARGNAAAQQKEQGRMQGVLNELLEERRIINIALSAAEGSSTGAGPSLKTPIAGGGLFPYLGADPVGAGRQTADLLKKAADNEARTQQVRAMLQGPLPASVTPPAMNTPTSSFPAVNFATPTGLMESAPAWWKSAQPARM